MAAPCPSGRHYRGNLLRGKDIDFRFCPNGTSDPSTTTIYGPYIDSVTRTATGTYLLTLQHRHSRLMSFTAHVVQATCDTVGPPLVALGAIVEGSTSATTLVLYTMASSDTGGASVYARTDIAAAATTLVVGTARFEEITG